MPRPRPPPPDDMFPDINVKTGTPSGADGGGFFPPGEDDIWGSRPGTAESEGMTFEEWQKRAGVGPPGGSAPGSRPGTAGSGEDEFSRTDGATDYYNNELAQSQSQPALQAFGSSGGSAASKLKSVVKKTKGSMHEVVKQAKGVARATAMLDEKKQEVSKKQRAREKVMKQRQDHEAWVEQLAAACDATNAERERLSAEIIFLEHNMERKRLLRVILRLSRFKSHSAFQTWVHNTIKPERDRKFALRDQMKKDLAALRVQMKEDTEKNELLREKILEQRLNNSSTEQYNLFLKIFSKLAGDKTREYFAHWMGMYRSFMKQYNLVAKIMGRMVNQTMLKGWVKWYHVVFIASKMTLDEQLKALKFELGKARQRCNLAEKAVEDVANKAMADMLAKATKGQRALLNKILSKFCTLYIRYGMKKWTDQIKLYKTAKQKMQMIISRLMNSELNYGLRKWTMVCMKDKATAGDMMALCIKVEQMRESVQLQAIAADRVAHGIPDLADEFANISYVDRAASENPQSLIKLMPPGALGGGGAGGAGAPGQPSEDMLQTTVFYGANKMVPASSASLASSKGPSTGFYGRGNVGNDSASLASSLESPSLNFAGIGFGTPMAPEDRANLLKHKKVIKRLALVGDPRLSACIKAYERTKDIDDLLESIEMIAAGMDFNVTPMY
ncbi:mannosyl-oligosaccharide 1,2-alpha-mannosidase [Aureococcus anophagefferens]|nr:mannosyl-oligosaccharide 1,2-alpha-mannosidase [Aureococcus anophagefferens]